MPTSALAVAHANIALVKYWGKEDSDLNLPAANSLSASIADLNTRTLITLDPSLEEDRIEINDTLLTGKKREKIVHHINRFRDISGVRTPCRVDSHNSFPTASGLASSASGFAALTLALDKLYDLNLPTDKLSALARLGSGSAARSLYGGYVEMIAGKSHERAHAKQLYSADHWPLKCTIAITHEGEKEVSSSSGMVATMETSPYYDAWIKSIPAAIEVAKNALKNKDFGALTEIAEASALRMHASAIGANPGILYWNGATIHLIHLVRQLRHDGLHVFFTIDAGPHVKIFSTPEDQYPLIRALRAEIQKNRGVLRFIATHVGGEPRAMTIDV